MINKLIPSVLLLVLLLLGGCDSGTEDPRELEAQLELELAEAELAEALPEGLTSDVTYESSDDSETVSFNHPPRYCNYNSQCYSNSCWCISGQCKPHGVGPHPPQEFCDYPPDFWSGDAVACNPATASSDCADHCLCRTGGYGNYCKPFGVGPHPPLSSCAPSGGGSWGGGGDGDGGGILK